MGCSYSNSSGAGGEKKLGRIPHFFDLGEFPNKAVFGLVPFGRRSEH